MRIDSVSRKTSSNLAWVGSWIGNPGQPAVVLVIVRCANNDTLEREVHEAKLVREFYGAVPKGKLVSFAVCIKLYVFASRRRSKDIKLKAHGDGWE